VQNLQLPRLGGSFGFRRKRDMMERQAVTGGGGGEVRVVADDGDDVRGKVARLPAQHEVVKAVIRL
jgi:hypothetical protein